ncbi:MAG: YicC/YloC family endoribonuclease [Pseudomonadota bacterium]
MPPELRAQFPVARIALADYSGRMTAPDPKTALNSMTGFAARTGAYGPWSWTAELRAVNGKGLDLRVRAPDWIEGLEPALRALVAARVTRGNVTLNLRLSREEGGGTLAVAPAGLTAMLEALSVIEAQAMDAGLSLAPSTATQIAGLRGVLETASDDADSAALRAAILEDTQALVAAFADMRAREGAALTTLLGGQLDEVEATLARAATAAAARAPRMEETLKRNLALVLDSAEADPQRIAQELALIATRADVTEEIDRLHTHIAAARDLLGAGGAAGRKLDFLMQEFMREANTLCSKAQDSDLTQAGLDLKVLIDQMREQVQNVE